MTADHDEPILDACLDEVLGGRTPPDLTSRILRSWASREEIAAPEPPPILTGLPQSLVDTAANPVVALRGDASGRYRERKRISNRLAVAIAIGFVGLSLSLAIAAVFSSGRYQIARGRAEPGTKASPSIVSGDITVDVPPPEGTPRPEAPQLALNVSPPASPPNPDSRTSSQPASDQSSKEPTASQVPAPSPAPIFPERRYLLASPDSQIVSFINAEMARTWLESGVRPAPPITDSEWCQRLFARVLGRTATAEELKSFVDDKATDRREKLVERLLTGSEYTEAFARNWSAVWTNVLIGRNGGQAGSMASRQELESYFRSALTANRPFDQIAHDLLTATGSSQPGSDDYNPAVNFLLDGMDASAMVATARVGRVLLGHQLQCAQCHTHPTQGWSQEQYWALNTFFRQMKTERRGNVSRLVNVDFKGQGPGSDGEVFYETPDGLVKAVFPRFIDGTEIPTSGQLAAVDRRRELARLIVQSDDLPKALVNRVWAHFFDYGFTRPVDDFGPSTSPSRPPALDRLATEFAAHNFNLKSLIRWTVMSDPFGRSSKITDLASKDMPEEGELALFSRYYARPKQAGDAFNTLVQAARIRKTAGSDTEREKARVDWLAQFNRGAAKDIGKSAVGTGPSLLVKGGDQIRSTTGGDPGGLIKKLAANQMPFDKKVEHLFWAALARQPAQRERQSAAELLRINKDNPTAALEDIWWSLLNSNECVLDH
jgi:uncharacterized protein DUF1549/uncharacterized protein DUF1553